VWDARAAIEPGPKPRLQGVSIHRGGVRALAALHNGTLAVACGDGAVRVYDVNTGAVFTKLPASKRGVGALAALRCGKLVMGLHDFTVQVWDVGQAARVAEEGIEWSAVVQLTDGRIAIGSLDVVEVVDTISLDFEAGQILEYSQGENGTALTALPDGRLVGGTDSGDVVVWDTRTSATHAADNTPARRVGHIPVRGHCAGNAVSALLPLPGGRLASGTEDGRLYLWHVPPA